MKSFCIKCFLFFLPFAGESQTLLDLNKKFVELFQQGKYEEAIPYAERAFAMAKRELSTDHPDYATNLENLGWVYLTAGYYPKAVPAYTELITIKQNLLGKEHPDYATMLNNLAILYYYMGEYLKAEPYYLESIQIRKKVLGEEHPDYATSLDNLGALYVAVDEHEKAEPRNLPAGGTPVNNADVLAYVKASAAMQGLPLDDIRAQAVAVHLARTAHLAKLLEDAPMAPEDELAEIYKPMTFKSPSNINS